MATRTKDVTQTQAVECLGDKIVPEVIHQEPRRQGEILNAEIGH